MKLTKKLFLTALCMALGVALPLAFHGIPNAGHIFGPMHLPVLLCGLICGPWMGALCGAVVPALSCLLSGMPPVGLLPSMVCELAVYGLVAGLLHKWIRTKSPQLDATLALIGSMLVGRLVMGAVNALIFRAGEYSWELWLAASFVTALPGIVLQLLVIPAVYFALRRAKLLER